MQIIPAIDLQNGLVVRAIAGRRHEYRPLVSPLAADPRPRSVARGLIETLGLSEFYVADLDAIDGGEPAWALYRDLIDAGASLWIDCGLSDLARAESLARFAAAHREVTGLIAGLESIGSAKLLGELLRLFGPERLIFSLDLVDGRPRVVAPQWLALDPRRIAAAAIGAGAGRMIVLDLAAVGNGGGCPTLDLCRDVRSEYPGVQLIAGGGVRGVDDVQALSAAGCDAALVATALHDGRIGRAELIQYESRGMTVLAPGGSRGLAPAINPRPRAGG